MLWNAIAVEMPFLRAGTLTFYSLTAFVLFMNDLIQEDTVMDRETLPKVEMPNRHSFIPDKLEDIPYIEKRGCYKTYGVCP